MLVKSIKLHVHVHVVVGLYLYLSSHGLELAQCRDLSEKHHEHV